MLVAVEGLRCYVVQLVVVVVAEVVKQLHRTLVSFDEVVVGTRHNGMFYFVTLHLLHLLDGVHLVGVGIMSTIQFVLVLGIGTLIDEVFLQRLPRRVVEEVLLAVDVDDDVELLGVETCKDAVAGEDEVLRTEGATAAVVVNEQGVELLQCGATHKSRVGNGEQHRHRSPARLTFVGIEFHPLQFLLVLESLLGEGHQAVGGEGVAIVVKAAVNLGYPRRVIYRLDIGMIDDILRRGGDDVAAANQTHLMDVGLDVFAHTFLQGVTVVRAAAAPALRGQEGRRAHCRLLQQGLESHLECHVGQQTRLMFNTV